MTQHTSDIYSAGGKLFHSRCLPKGYKVSDSDVTNFTNEELLKHRLCEGCNGKLMRDKATGDWFLLESVPFHITQLRKALDEKTVADITYFQDGLTQQELIQSGWTYEDVVAAQQESGRKVPALTEWIQDLAQYAAILMSAGALIVTLKNTLAPLFTSRPSPSFIKPEDYQVYDDIEKQQSWIEWKKKDIERQATLDNVTLPPDEG